VALLGTKYTMEKRFFKYILKSFEIETLVPDGKNRDCIHDIIYNELALGICNPKSKEKYLKIIAQLIKEGAEGVILGCTEIPLLIQQEDVSVPVFDTAEIHATAAFNFSTAQDLQ
jgi:aspartate racemase